MKPDMKTEFQKLLDRWHAKTGEKMPTAIAALPVDRIRFAVTQVESGATVFVPPSQHKVEREAEEVSSMVQWDKHAEH